MKRMMLILVVFILIGSGCVSTLSMFVETEMQDQSVGTISMAQSRDIKARIELSLSSDSDVHLVPVERVYLEPAAPIALGPLKGHG